MKRSKHSLSNYKLTTLDMGKLVPVNCVEVLPGDAIQQASSVLLRVSPLLAPVMHPVSIRLHHWFVPHRLVWDGWEDFITGGQNGTGGTSGAFPTITAHAVNGFTAGTLPDYLGLPPGTSHPGLVVSALPVRSCNLIYNEFYADEDLVTPLVVPTASGADTTSPLTVPNIAWEKDYFTSARPWAQKGPAVTLPLGNTAPLHFLTNTGGLSAQINAGKNFASTGNTVAKISDAADVNASNLAVANLASATSVDVNTVRRAFAIQRYQEARARYGSRYTEYLRYLGVRSSDARLQRPEYLGGGKQTISFTEVLQTSPNQTGGTSASAGVAEMKGHGIAAMRSRRFRRFFEEHGFIITMMSVRPRTMYVQGQHRMWSRRAKEDFWQKELELIGQQEIYRKELYAQAPGAAAGDTLFGYQDRYDDYRRIPSTVTGEFRSLLNYWHMGRIFGSAPTLNQSFTDCDPTKRINAVQTNQVLWCMINNSIQARRLVGNNTQSRIM